MSLSAILVLNGLGMSAPFVVGRCFPICKQEMLVFERCRHHFDVGYLLLAVIFSDEESFGNSGTWIVAVVGVIIPVFSLTLRLRSMSRALMKSRAVAAVARRLHKMSIGIRRRFCWSHL